MSSRFKFEPLPPIGEVVVGKGKPYEVSFNVPSPSGKFWVDTSLDMLELVDKFGHLVSGDGSTADRTSGILSAFRELSKSDKFWKVLYPSALGITGTKDEKEFAEYVATYPTPIEIVESFVEAANMIVTKAFSDEGSKEAMAKLEGGEAVGTEDSKATSDGSTQLQ